MRSQASCRKSYVRWEVVASLKSTRTTIWKIPKIFWSHKYCMWYISMCKMCKVFLTYVRHGETIFQSLQPLLGSGIPSKVIHWDFSASKRCMFILGRERNQLMSPSNLRLPVSASSKVMRSHPRFRSPVCWPCWPPQTYKKPKGVRESRPSTWGTLNTKLMPRSHPLQEGLASSWGHGAMNIVGFCTRKRPM